MHRDTHLLRRSQRLLLQLLEELEHRATPSRAQLVARLEIRLSSLEDAVRSHLPTQSDATFLSHQGQQYEVLRAAVHGGTLPHGVRRRAVVRTLQLVQHAMGTLPGEEATVVERALRGTGNGVRWFATSHPLLLTLILLVLIIVLLWRQDFLVTTRFGQAEITIQGRHTIQTNGVDSMGLAP